MKALILGLALIAAGAFFSSPSISLADPETPAASPTATKSATVSPTATKSPTVAPPTIGDAEATRDALLATAQLNLAELANAQFLGFFPQWRTQYPGLLGGGSAIVATGAGVVSTSYNLLDSKSMGGPQNPTVVALAVGDTSGRCAGSVLYGFPKTDKVMKISNPTPCTAQGVVTAFKVAFAAAATPSTTTPPATAVAPKPPATGSGADAQPSQERNWPFLALGLALVAGAGMLSVSARSRRT